MPNIRIRPHIILLCVVTVYLSTVEGRYTNIEDDSFSDIDRKADLIITHFLNKRQSGKSRRYKQKSNEAKTLGKLIEMIYRSNEGKGDLRGDSLNSVRSFLDKLNNFINQNTHKDYYAKRDDCRFGFGPPGSCKRNKFRRYSNNRNLTNRSWKEKKDKLDYAKHMLVERAKYTSSSSESNSDDDTLKLNTRQKSRFEIVNNKKKSKRKPKGSFEDPDSDDKTVQMENTDDSAESSSEEQERIVNDDDKSEETRKEASGDSDSVEEDYDEKYLYLQGTRLQEPNVRARQRSKSPRRGYRMPYFLPKRYKWDDNMLPHLDEYWEVGIKAYDTYRHKYVKDWPPLYFK